MLNYYNTPFNTNPYRFDDTEIMRFVVLFMASIFKIRFTF